MQNYEQEKDQLLEYAIDTLIAMWNQYCGEDGHQWMCAGEETSDILMRLGLLKDEWSKAEPKDGSLLYTREDIREAIKKYLQVQGKRAK